MKKGFTLTELLVVIAIIGLVIGITVPGIVDIKNNVNKRLLAEKEDLFSEAAVLYATDNPGKFGDGDTIEVYVSELIEAGYLKAEKSKDCDPDDTMGCIVNPENNSSLNKYKVCISKNGSNISAKKCDTTGAYNMNDGTLISKICQKFNNGGAQAYYNGEIHTCYCNEDGSELYIKEGNNSAQIEVNACLFSGASVANYFKTEKNSQTYYRVLGLYKYDGVIYPKIITDDPLE